MENKVHNLPVDNNADHARMTPEEVAQFLRKSVSWVYKNWQRLGGRKLGGSLLFPGKEDLYERLFYKGEGVEVRLHPTGNQEHESLVPNQKRSNKSRIKKEKGGGKPATRHRDSDRHGIF